jgi:MFS family permease
MGDWFVRVASLLVLDRLAPGSGDALGTLVIVKTIPPVFISPIGGFLADKYDRRKIMMTLDCIGAVAVLFFLLAIRLESLFMFYVVTFVRATIHALYEPSTKSIVPMIVPELSSLKRAATLNGMAWAFMLVLGGVVAGDSAGYIGLQVCYVIDSVTYFVSAVVLSRLEGDYMVSHQSNVEPTGAITAVDERSNVPTDRQNVGSMYRLRHACQPVFTFCQMVKEVFTYLQSSGFGSLVLLKATGTIIFGPSDILNVSYAEIAGDEVATSKRLGYLFSSLGLGYVLGPIAANFYTDTSQPKTLQLACTSSFIFMTVGWIGISQAPSFSGIAGFSIIRAFGSGILWINSTLLLQTLTRPDLLGRILALEFGLSMLSDAAAATLTGHLKDRGYTPSQLSSGVGAVSGLFFCGWSIYHLFGRGAARKKFN